MTVPTNEDYQLVRKAQVEQALRAMKDLGDLLRREAAREGISLEELETMLDTHNQREAPRPLTPPLRSARLKP